MPYPIQNFYWSMVLLKEETMKPKQKHTGVLNIVRGVMSDFGGPMTAHEIQSLSKLPIKTVRNAIFQLVVHNDARKEKELKDGYIAYSINKSREEAKKIYKQKLKFLKCLWMKSVKLL